MDHEHYFVACPGVLGVRTNTTDFRWSFGTTMPPATREQYDACSLRLRLDVVDHIPLPDADRLGKYHYWLGAYGEDTIYYDRAFCFGSRLRLAAKGLLSDEPTLTVNRTYYRYISHRFMNLHSIGYILSDAAALLLLRRGFAPLHCSAFKYGNATAIVAAPPNTGKTLTTMMACLDHAADFIAEDIAISDGLDVFCVPWTSTFRYYREIDRSRSARVRSKLTELIPLLELWKGRRPAPITKYISCDRIENQSRLTHVVFLERGDTELRSIDIEEAHRKMRNLNRYEFNHMKAPLIVAHEYFNSDLNVESACRSEDRLIRRLLDNSAHHWVAVSDDPTAYARMLVEEIDRQPERRKMDREAA